jgi:hypothetical protein
MPHLLAELRAREVQAATRAEGDPKPDLDLPYDLKRVKNEFIKIVNYKSTFGKEYHNLAYESDYGVKATSRIIKPGSTLEQMGESAMERQKRKEQKEKLDESRKQFNVSRSLQYLCALQAGGAEKFRQKIDKVKHASLPDRQTKSQGGGSRSGSHTPVHATSRSHNASMSSVASASQIDYNLELDDVENDILKNLKATAAKRELVRTFNEENSKKTSPKAIKREKSTPQLYRRLSRLPSVKDNLLPPLDRTASKPSTPPVQEPELSSMMLTQLNVDDDDRLASKGSSQVSFEENVVTYETDFIQESSSKPISKPNKLTPKSAAACGSPAAKVGSPAPSPTAPRPKAAKSPKKPSTARAAPVISPKSAASKPTKEDLNKTAPSAICSPNYRKPNPSKTTSKPADTTSSADVGDYDDDFAAVDKVEVKAADEPEYGDDFATSEPSSPAKAGAAKEEDVDYDVDFEEDSAVDRGSVAGFGSVVGVDEVPAAVAEEPVQNNTTISITSKNSKGDAGSVDDMYGDDFDN